jgi:rare lipoprotein A
MRTVRLFFFSVLLISIVACHSTKPSTLIAPIQTAVTVEQKDSAPPMRAKRPLASDVVPKPVRRTLAGNKSPYTVFGRTYTVLSESKGYRERGNASWYGTKFHGRRTSNGEIYDMWGMTAAHKTLPIPSYVRVTNVENGRSVTLRVNDRGPFHHNRIIDLSYGASLKLGFADKGVVQVDVVDVTPSESAAVPPATAVTTTVPSSVLSSSLPIKTAAEINPGEYYQLGAFQQATHAHRLYQSLLGLLPVPVYIVPSSDNIWHRVQVGPITNAQVNVETRQVLYEQGFDRPRRVIHP